MKIALRILLTVLLTCLTIAGILGALYGLIWAAYNFGPILMLAVMLLFVIGAVVVGLVYIAACFWDVVSEWIT